MDRQAAYRRFISDFISKCASLPAGGMLTMLDLLSRAQFMEALSGHRFNTVSARAGSNKNKLSQVIGQMMLEIDSTVDPDTSIWTYTGGSSGLYKSAWLGANRIFQKTQSSPFGVPLEATDLLSANMLKALEGKDVRTPDELVAAIQGETDEAKKEIFQKQLLAINAKAVEDVMLGNGNFFFEAGKRFRPKKEAVVQGKIDMDTIGGAVAMYAKKKALSALDLRDTEARASAKAVRQEMAPGAGEEGDFDLDTLTPKGWAFIIQEVLADPQHPFSRKMINWMVYDLDHSGLTERQHQVMRFFFDQMIDGIPIVNDANFAKAFNERFPEAPISRTYLHDVLKLYMESIGKRLKSDQPTFMLEAEDYLFLMNAQQGRGKFASMNRTSAEKILRTKLIRLAHAKPELRPYLLPLLKQADEGALAGRTWGNPDPHSTPDDNSPYNSHPDSPPAGADGSPQRTKYNKWFQDNVCPGHKTNCGDPERFK